MVKEDKHAILYFSRGGSRTATTSKMERFVIRVNGIWLSGYVTTRTYLLIN